MHRVAVAASVIAALAVACPAYAQGNSQAHRKSAPPSRDPLPSPEVGTSTGGATPFAWLDDASVLEPGSISVAVSTVRWQGSDASEVVAPVVDIAIGLAKRLHLTASVPRVPGSADSVEVGGEIGTSFFSVKIGMFDDPKRGVKLSVSPTLEMLGSGVLQAIEPGASRVRFGLPVSAELDRGALRLFAGGGYFSGGVWFSGVGAGIRLNPKVFFSGSISRAWRNVDVPGVPSDRDRNEVSGSAAYAVNRRISVFGSLGQTIATLDENGAGTTLGCGFSLFFRPAIKAIK
jgi:hypothetical protein